MARIQLLLDIMARLRDPEGGCPWDLRQDFESISPHTIEEAYEVDEAIMEGDLKALRDELGDLLFQVVFQARLAEEQGAFDFAGVVEAIVDKLVRRHPHVFSDAAAPSTAEDQRAHWEAIKAAERAGDRPGSPPIDPFQGIPRRLPALARCAKLAGRLERLDDSESRELRTALPDASAVDSRSESRARMWTERLSSLSQSVRSLGEAVRGAGIFQPAESSSHPAGEEASGDPVEWKRLIGEGLRGWVLVARSLGVDAEQALRFVDDEAIDAARRSADQASRPTIR
jgi:NTP pyrophosphatase (non-canonical NTP hydrolase)